MSRLPLLPPDALVRTGPVDHADWNYRFGLGWLIRRRFALLRGLLPATRGTWLEIGYGSGVLMRFLATQCDELHGIDLHDHAAEVTEQLRGFDVEAILATGSAEALPYETATFDCIVAVSTLEFIENIELAAAEMNRVLKPNGRLVFVMPGNSPVLDFGLKLVTGESAKNDYGDRRERLLPALRQEFEIADERSFPPVISSVLPVYTARSLRPIPQDEPVHSKPKPR